MRTDPPGRPNSVPAPPPPPGGALRPYTTAAMREAAKVASEIIDRVIKALTHSLNGAKVLPLSGFALQLYKNIDFTAYADEGEPTNDIDTAQVVSSEILGWEGYHLPVLDIDMPARLVPSSTPGHYHLYIERPLPWDRYVILLHALADAGIVQHSFVTASIERGSTRVRLPWIRKGQENVGAQAASVEVAA